MRIEDKFAARLQSLNNAYDRSHPVQPRTLWQAKNDTDGSLSRALELLRGYTYPASRSWETEVEEFLAEIDKETA